MRNKRIFVPQASGITSTDHFDIDTYTGPSFSISGLSFQPDFVWTFSTDDSDGNILHDSVRGVRKVLFMTSNGPEYDRNALTSYNSDGATFGDYASLNHNGVAYSFKGGGNSNTYNIDGTGYSTVSAAGLDGGQANPSGASVNTASGLGIYKVSTTTASRTMEHGLPSIPQMYIFKSTSKTQNWYMSVYDSSDSNWKFGSPNTTNAFGVTTAYTADADNIVIGGGGTTTEVAYAFCNIDGYQKMGVFTKSATYSSSDSVTLNLGFRPRFIMTRDLDNASNVYIGDVERSWAILRADTTGAESGSMNVTSVTNSGITFNPYHNGSSATMFYLAIA